MKVEVPDALVDKLADGVAERLAARLAAAGSSGAGTPWRTTEEAIEYTRLPRSTFEKLAAQGVFGGRREGRRSVFHVSELDRGLGYIPREGGATPLRRSEHAA